MSNPAFPLSTGPDPSLTHLWAELARIAVLIHREVRRWQLAGQDATDSFRGLFITEAEVDGLLARPPGCNWGDMVLLAPEEAQGFAQAEAAAANQTRRLIDRANKKGQTLQLARLATTFGLDPFELDTLLICLAPTLDLRYERLYGYLQNDVTRKRPTVNLVLDLLAAPGPTRLQHLAYFADEAPLITYHLLERRAETNAGHSLLSQTLTVDETIVAWLLGRYQPQADLGPRASLEQPLACPAEAEALIPPPLQAGLADLARAETPPLLLFYGPDQTGQQTAARLLAARLERPLLRVDMAGVIDEEVPSLAALRLALRDARLLGALPYLSGSQACLDQEGRLPPALLAELCAYPDLAIVAGHPAWQPAGLERNTPIYSMEFPVPAYAQRLTLWQHYLRMGEYANTLPGTGGRMVTSPDEIKTEHKQSKIVNRQSKIDLAPLAGQFALTSGQIRDAVASARDMAAQRGDHLQGRDLFLAARAHSNPRLGTLARKIEPRYGWTDIILPADQLALLREIVATVRGRPQVLEGWGVGHKLASSATVTVLFSGDPGTGKTMAAEIIAGELRLDLYKIDLSTVVSKYIGETEKNLEQIFNEAETSNAILFFDEADAIFGKRSEVKDAHDRYANIEISYLLQRMELYDGVTILATNLRANLDEAFTRRLQFAVDFPFPEKEDRLRIWRTLFPPDVPREPELDFELLARRFKLAGGNIRNIIVSAAYLAANDGECVTMDHLLHSTRRELQKMGRLVSEAEFQSS